MTAVGELLDAARERTGIPSDNALAARLGIQRQLLSKARAGEKPLSDERIAQICALAKLDGPTWIAMIHAERATTATERALWRLMLDRMGAAAAVVALVALSMPGLANAKTAQNQAVSGGLLTHSVYYVTHNGGLPCFLPQPRHLLLSAANLGQLARQLVAIDALSYVQSQ